MFQQIATIVRKLHPRPDQWPFYVRRLASAHGWMPPILMVAAFGVMFPISFFAVLNNQPLLQFVGISFWLIWLVIGGLSSLLVARRSVSHVMRMGVTSVCRPRYWFEVSRFLLI